ncbi:MAG: flagellar biosynthesis anti-sigma factor FlgM [Lachnospiraceae bacterium]|nr:flagellar biosynthesis anti-sigma factor FlgM [Lachnospiraceae bacterium]
MRIDAYNQVAQIYKTNTRMKTQKTEKASMRDKVEISDFGKVYQTTKKAVNEASDVREDKVADIKSRIDNGSYEVSNEDFANKLLESYGALY